jgi:hypothetical protein
MTEKKRRTVALASLVFILIVLFSIFKSTDIVIQDTKVYEYVEETNEDIKILYNDEIYHISFEYPDSWGNVIFSPSSLNCPEEDTYRTADTLNIFDRELRFKDQTLPESESFVRIGIRIYYLDPKNEKICGSEAISKIGTKQMTGEEFSSFRLDRIELEDFFGVHNLDASRLDTEGREQYTFFLKDQESNNLVLVIQPYFSFVPYANSKEWAEIEEEYKGDMVKYINSGDTALPLREMLEDFRIMAESLKKSSS